MGGWLNFSSDHVEPIKADHGTQPPPPTSSTFFVLSLFPPRVLAFIHPLSAPSPSPARARERAFSFSDVPSSVSLPPARRAIRRPSPSSRHRAAPRHAAPLRSAPRPRSPSIPSSFSRLVHSLTLWQLVGFFRVTRRCNLFGREVERHPRRWSTKRAGVGSVVRGLRGG